jgi:uncharacterized YigZ family protein
MTKAYPIIASDLIFSEEIKKSKFITFIGHIEGKKEAMEFLAAIKKQHINARHHCWAYIGASPSDLVNIGCSDDGEPKGTAGRPILSVLQGSNIGEIIAVVIRYSSGIKLGTGGLVRAYSNGVQQALKGKVLITKSFYKQYQLVCDYSQLSIIENLLPEFSAKILQVTYQNEIQAIIEVDQLLSDLFEKKFCSRIKGKVKLENYPPHIYKL